MITLGRSKHIGQMALSKWLQGRNRSAKNTSIDLDVRPVKLLGDVPGVVGRIQSSQHLHRPLNSDSADEDTRGENQDDGDPLGEAHVESHDDWDREQEG